MSTVRQCPFCELRFEWEHELEEHIKADHGREMHKRRPADEGS